MSGDIAIIGTQEAEDNEREIERIVIVSVQTGTNHLIGVVGIKQVDDEKIAAAFLGTHENTLGLSESMIAPVTMGAFGDLFEMLTKGEKPYIKIPNLAAWMKNFIPIEQWTELARLRI